MLLEDLRWRYATKKMNARVVSSEKLNYILEAARLSPSASGLQPYKIIAISDKELLEKIKSVAFNQNQIIDCSHLLVFASWDRYTNERITKVLNYIMDERDQPYSTMESYKKIIINHYENMDPESQAHDAEKQCYIAFAMAIAAAAEQKVDTTPIGGFRHDMLDKLLQLKGSGYKSTVILPLGYRDINKDWLVNQKKVRTPKEDFIKEMTIADASEINSQDFTQSLGENF